MMDTDKNGKISKSEWDGHHRVRMAEFSQIDQNKDSNLSDSELRTFHMNKMKNHIKGGHHGKGPMPPRHGPNPHQLIQKIDANNDGKISKREWDSHHKNLFRDLDTNKDSNVVIGEFLEFHNKMKGKHPKR